MCFHGQCVISESENLPSRLYESNWIEMIDAKHNNGDYGKLLLMFMNRLNKNGQIVIGKLYPLSLRTFNTVCVYTRKMNKKKKKTDEIRIFNTYSNFLSSHFRLCHLHTVYSQFFVRFGYSRTS